MLFALFSFFIQAASIRPGDAPKFAKWSAFRSPSAGEAQPIGGFAAGCLAGAVEVPLDGVGFAVMRPSRNRHYAHPTLDAFVHALGAKMKGAGYVLVGDLSPPRGGPMANGHNSHQTGLDADLWLNLGAKRPTARQRESWGATSFVRGRKNLRRGFGAAQVRLLSTAANFAEVNRIFVSPPIKRYFCQKNPNAPWLHKLRAWWGHEEHAHVRLNCPAGANACASQPPLDPKDNGCGKDLEWWFTKEADDEWHKLVTAPPPREFPELPAACNAVAGN